jgi:selT/selW/selH-like putative selenoprotein
MEQAQSQLKKGLLIMFCIFLVFDIIPRMTGPPAVADAATAKPAAKTETINQENAGSNDYVPPHERQTSEETTTTYQRETDGKIHVVNIQYCVSCSYKGLFQQIQQHIQTNYPTMIVEGSEYPVSPQKALLSKIFTYAQYALLAVAMFGDQIFAALKFTPPPIYHKLKEKKMMVFFFVFFMGNSLRDMLTSTGAFEVSLDGETVWSKLASGEKPGLADIDRIFAGKFA